MAHLINRSLKGKTIFITGASRGIGLAIALRAARDGANIVVAAKTDKPHPKLPGTIHTAADEIRKAGGNALAILTDIRYDDQIENAVKKAVSEFGGIDILINNASAISLTPTLETSPKAFDLMHTINNRGTFLTTRACIPFLLKASNPHILNLSPPLSLNPRWFKKHSAYTVAKYAMSMYVLGMAEEYRQQGIGVNAIWPLTAIATAAIQNIVGGDALVQKSRRPEIMADAAHIILTSDSKQTTGNFFIDEELLRKNGVKNFDKYCVNVEKKDELFFDFFLDPDVIKRVRSIKD